MKARLLFVDDDRLVLATLSKGLRRAGYIVDTADSGKVALDLAASVSFDLAIVDIHMPGMSGFELAGILRDTHGLATLFLSAYSDQKLVEEAAHTIGGIGYVVKPVGLPQLLPAVETALARSLDLCSLLDLQKREQLYYALLQKNRTPQFMLDRNHCVIAWNSACEELTGVKSSAVIGTRDHWKAFYSYERPCLADAVLDQLNEHELASLYPTFSQLDYVDGGLQAEAWLTCADGEGKYLFFNAVPVNNDSGELIAVIETLQDMTERKHNEQQLKYRTTHDDLTGLANRMLLEDRLEQAIRHAQLANTLVAVLMLDLDRFKKVNDGYGHALGDELLCMVADRLKTTVRQTDTVARLGGDEFVVVLTDVADLEAVQGITATILTALAKPYLLRDHTFNLTASVGVSLFPYDGVDGPILIRNADIAMSEAKKQGNRFSYYTDRMNSQVVATIEMENDLYQAVANDELRLHYQPKVDLATGKITGCEALVRWQHPQRGMVPPGMFIPIAEQTGLIVTIGSWVLEETCRQILAWQAQGFPPVRIAVNLSARQFRQGDLVASVRAVLERHGLDPTLLELELTESMIMDDPENTRQVLQELRSLGITLSLDDFGTGFSSLNYLRRFPVDSLKIDQSFISEVTTDPSGASVVSSIIDIAHNLGLIAIAEGVETQEQLMFLVANDCDAAQGFLFSKPVPPQEFSRLLEQDGQFLKQRA